MNGARKLGLWLLAWVIFTGAVLTVTIDPIVMIGGMLVALAIFVLIALDMITPDDPPKPV